MNEEVIEILSEVPNNQAVRLARLYITEDLDQELMGYSEWHEVLLEADGRLALRVHTPWEDAYLRLRNRHEWQAVDENPEGEPAVPYSLPKEHIYIMLKEFEVSVGLVESAPFP